MSRELRPASAPVSGVREPHRVAIVQDWGVGVPPLHDQYDATQLAFEEATASGLLDRPVELKVIECEGLPYKRLTTLGRALREVVEDWDPIAIIGPHQTENVLALRPQIDAWGIPHIAQSGTMAAPGPWTFLTQNGTFPDESRIMVDWLVDVAQCTRIGLIVEDNLLGIELAEDIRSQARRRAIEVVATSVLGSFISEDDARNSLETFADAKVDGYCYVGFGATAFQILAASKAAAAEGFDVPRITMSIFMGSIPGLGYGLTPAHYEGWTGVDQYDERNPVFMALLDRFAARYDGRRPMHCYTAQGYDMGNVVAHGLSMAKPLSRDGLRLALEKVRRLPAAAASPGTVISYGPYDHRGYKGDYITLRRVRDGVNELALSKSLH